METCQLSLRRMRLIDVDAVMEVERASFSSPWTESQIRAEVICRDTRSCPLVLVDGTDTIVGYFIVWNIAGEMHLLSIAVHPDHRRKGYGRRMLATLLCWAERTAVSEIFLEVRQSNAAAQALYRSFGFATSGIRKGYYTDNREDAVVMRVVPYADAQVRKLALAMPAC